MNITISEAELLKEFDKKFGTSKDVAKLNIFPSMVSKKNAVEQTEILAREIKQFIKQAYTAGQAQALELAEAQLLGFYHGRWNRNDISGLISSMGLDKKEWKQLNKMFDMNYLTKKDRKEIEESLSQGEDEQK